MAQHAQDAFDTLISYVQQGYTNFLNNARSFINMSGLQWVRIITIIGAYLLIRPYLQKAATQGAMRKQEEAMKSEDVIQRQEDRRLEKMDFVTPNVLRGINEKKVELPDDSDEEEGTATGADAKWGSKERKRQRQLVKKIIMQEEKARREAKDVGTFYSDEDKDIEEYLS